MASPERFSLADTEFSRSIVDLARRFVQRWDIHCQQLPDGRYISINQPMTVDHLAAHLRGEITLGTYVLDPQSQAKFMVLDADDDAKFQELMALAERLPREEAPAYLEISRRGGHAWFFFEKAVAGGLARAFGQGLLAAHHLSDMEVYPKQGSLKSGPGSLIRMPFGIHQLTGKRYGFVSPAGDPISPTLRGQIQALSFPQIVSTGAVLRYQGFVPSEPPKPLPRSPGEASGTVSERIKGSITAMEFIGQYVELKPTGSGGLGYCPFHDDQRKSFGVSAKGNYWSCFAGCGGGSIIDFWMKWRKIDFKTAVRELADMLL